MSPLIAEGVELMLVGMGTVFVFLTLLVIATRGMSALVMRLFPVAALPEPDEGAGPQGEELAAISIALAAHLKKRKRAQK